MRANLFEKLLKKMVEHKDDPQAMACLIAKAEILMDRSNASQSVVREISNW